MNLTKTKQLVTLALLTGLLVVMAFTPLGYLNVTLLNISFLTIPVAVGAIAIGPAGGAFLGLVFGLTSFARCFGLNALGTVLCGIDPVLTFLVCVVPRVLDGFLIGIIFKALARTNMPRVAGFAITGFLAAALNTVLYMSALVLLFGNTDIIQEYWQKLAPGGGAIAFIVAFVGINAVFEAIAATFVTAAVCAALYHAKLIAIPSSKADNASGAKHELNVKGT